jgi:alkylhydroperoxidase family enzyme
LALLKFAGKVNTNSPAVTRADVEATAQAGWTEAQVAEVVHTAALFAAFNRIANGFGRPSPYPDSL